MRKLLTKLSDMRAVSGHEYRINESIASLFEPYCESVKIDSLGSVIAYRSCGVDGAPSVMIEAHIDEIGMMVTSVTDDGFITFTDVGGVDERILPSLEVTVHGIRDVQGIIGFNINESETGKSYTPKSLAVDTGLDAAEVKRIIRPGDTITLPQSVLRLGRKQMSAKTMDDRAGVAALVRTMKKLRAEKLCCDVYAVAAVQEEVGCRGGKTTAFGIDPDMAVAIDVTHGITPDNDTNAFETGSGAIISRGPNLHPMLTERLVYSAQSKGIKYDIDVDGGCTGTDAWEIQTAGTGVCSALLSIPLKYMHTSVETLAVSDVKAVSDLLTEFIKGLEGDISWLAL